MKRQRRNGDILFFTLNQSLCDLTHHALNHTTKLPFSLAQLRGSLSCTLSFIPLTVLSVIIPSFLIRALFLVLLLSHTALFSPSQSSRLSAPHLQASGGTILVNQNWRDRRVVCSFHLRAENRQFFFFLLSEWLYTQWCDPKHKDKTFFFQTHLFIHYTPWREKNRKERYKDFKQLYVLV